MPYPDRFWVSSLVLMLVSGICATLVILTDRHDLSSAALILGAVVLFLSGVLLIPFSRNRSIDERFASLLQVQGMINLCRVAADLGIQGSACMIPSEKTGQQTVMQLMPVFPYTGGNLDGDSFVSGKGGVGILVPPAGQELFRELFTHHHLLIPEKREEFGALFHDITVEVWEIAREIQTDWNETGVSIIIRQYRLIEGCSRVARESPACCKMNPCFLCSIFASCIAEGLNLPVQVERCVPNGKEGNVEMILSVLEENLSESP